jgi:hypothetical protein
MDFNREEKMIKRSIMLIALTLIGCTTSRPITLPDGSKGLLIGCGGVQHSMEDCYVKAGEQCSSGYDIINSSEGNGPNSKMAALGGYNTGGIDRSLIVSCH